MPETLLNSKINFYAVKTIMLEKRRGKVAVKDLNTRCLQVITAPIVFPGLGKDRNPLFVLKYSDILCKCVAKMAALCK